MGQWAMPVKDECFMFHPLSMNLAKGTSSGNNAISGSEQQEAMHAVGGA